MSSEAGQGMAEYIIIAIIVAVAVIVAIRMYGGSLTGQLQNATDEIASVKGGVDRDAAKAGGEQGPGKSDEGGGVESLPATGKSAKGAGPRESVGNIDKQVHALRPGGIGDDEEVIGTFHLDMPILIGVGAVIIGLGISVVFLATKDQRKDKKAKKKEKKKSKSLFARVSGKSDKGGV